jgi:hypothetical protein
MEIQEQRTANRTSITVVVLALLCVAGYAYSQGWFDWSRLGSERTDGNNSNVSQELGQQKANGSTVPVTPEASALPATPAK